MLCCCCYDGLIVDRCLSYIQCTLLQGRAHTTVPGKYSRVCHSHWTGHERRQHFGDYHSKKEMGEGRQERGVDGLVEECGSLWLLSKAVGDITAQARGGRARGKFCKIHF